MKKRLVPLLLLGVVLSLPKPLTAQKNSPAPPPTAREKPPARPPDPMLEAWVMLLGRRIASQNPVIRRSARSALRAVGVAALPHLEKLAQGGDPLVAQAALSLVGKIKGSHRQGQPAQVDGVRQHRPGGRYARLRLAQKRRLLKAAAALKLEGPARGRVEELIGSFMQQAERMARKARQESQSREERRKLRRGAFKSFREQLGQVLTGEQIQLFLQNLRRGRPNGAGPPPKPQGKPGRKREEGSRGSL